MIDWSQFFRDICFDHFVRDPVRIGAPGIILKIDESLLPARNTTVADGLCRSEYSEAGIENPSKASLLLSQTGVLQLHKCC